MIKGVVHQLLSLVLSPKFPEVLELPDVQNKIAIFNFRRAQNSIFTRYIYLSILLKAQLLSMFCASVLQYT